MRAARDLRLLAPDDVEAVEMRRPGAEDQAAVADCSAAGAVRAGFAEAQIDALIPSEIGVHNDVGEAALPLDMDLRHSADLLLGASADVDQPQFTGLFGDQRHVRQR